MALRDLTDALHVLALSEPEPEHLLFNPQGEVVASGKIQCHTSLPISKFYSEVRRHN